MSRHREKQAARLFDDKTPEPLRGFEALRDKVHQAEAALEAKERQAAADWRQLKASWIAGWTPGRIVVAGLVSGFVVGKLEPAKKIAKGGGVLQLLTTLSSLFAGTGAHAAAGKAEVAAETAEETAAAVAPETAAAVAATTSGRVPEPPVVP